MSPFPQDTSTAIKSLDVASFNVRKLLPPEPRLVVLHTSIFNLASSKRHPFHAPAFDPGLMFGQYAGPNSEGGA